MTWRQWVRLFVDSQVEYDLETMSEVVCWQASGVWPGDNEWGCLLTGKWSITWRQCGVRLSVDRQVEYDLDTMSEVVCWQASGVWPGDNEWGCLLTGKWSMTWRQWVRLFVNRQVEYDLETMWSEAVDSQVECDLETMWSEVVCWQSSGVWPGDNEWGCLLTGKWSMTWRQCGVRLLTVKWSMTCRQCGVRLFVDRQVEYDLETMWSEVVCWQSSGVWPGDN